MLKNLLLNRWKLAAAGLVAASFLTLAGLLALARADARALAAEAETLRVEAETRDVEIALLRTAQAEQQAALDTLADQDRKFTELARSLRQPLSAPATKEALNAPVPDLSGVNGQYNDILRLLNEASTATGPVDPVAAPGAARPSPG